MWGTKEKQGIKRQGESIRGRTNAWNLVMPTAVIIQNNREQGFEIPLFSPTSHR